VQFIFCLGPSTLNALEKLRQPFASSIAKLIAQYDATAARDFDAPRRSRSHRVRETVSRVRPR